MFGEWAIVDCFAEHGKISKYMEINREKFGNPPVFIFNSAVGCSLPRFLEELLMDYDYVKIFFYAEEYTLWRWKILDDNGEPFGYWPQLFEIKEIL